MQNLKAVRESEGESLICKHCEFQGLMPFDTETCPNCGKTGFLQFLDSNDRELHKGLVYFPAKKVCIFSGVSE